jgi:hypothetical protein
VSWVRSDSGSAERRSTTRQNRATARSALRRFSSSADGLFAAMLLGEGDEAAGVGEGFGRESDSVQPTRQATMLTVNAHFTNRPNRVFNTHLPPILNHPKWIALTVAVKRPQRMLADANRIEGHATLARRPVDKQALP